MWWCCGFLDCGDLSSARCAVKPAAVSTEDITLLESFSSLYQLALKKVFLAGPSLFCNVSGAQRSTLDGVFLYWSAAGTSLLGKSGYRDGSTLCARLSSSTLPPWLLGFPPKAFCAAISSLLSSPAIFLKSTAVLSSL